MPFVTTVEDEWHQLKGAIKQAGFEALGFKKMNKRKNGLKVWYTEIENAVKEKRNAFLEYLNTQSDESKEKYKEVRNRTKTVSYTHLDVYKRQV